VEQLRADSEPLRNMAETLTRFLDDTRLLSGEEDQQAS
jgi:hypothetical protein